MDRRIAAILLSAVVTVSTMGASQTLEAQDQQAICEPGYAHSLFISPNTGWCYNDQAGGDMACAYIAQNYCNGAAVLYASTCWSTPNGVAVACEFGAP